MTTSMPNYRHAPALLYPMTANEVLHNYWNGRLPVDPEAIARAMGVDVVPDPNLNVSGQASSAGEGVEIRYNPFEVRVRQRFTIAHELGHIALGHTASGVRLRNDYSAAAIDPYEIAANRFAAELLMPEEAVRLVVRYGNESVESMANMFNVSGAAMTFRLKNLGILP